jgi:hypothetical protein
MIARFGMPEDSGATAPPDSSPERSAPIDFRGLEERCLDNAALMARVLEKFTSLAPEQLVSLERA